MHYLELGNSLTQSWRLHFRIRWCATSLVKDLAITVTGNSSKTKFEALKTKVGGSGTITGTIVDDPSNLTTTNAGGNATIVAKLWIWSDWSNKVNLDSKVTKIDLGGFKTAKFNIKNLTGRTIVNNAGGDYGIKDLQVNLKKLIHYQLLNLLIKQLRLMRVVELLTMTN